MRKESGGEFWTAVKTKLLFPLISSLIQVLRELLQPTGGSYLSSDCLDPLTSPPSSTMLLPLPLVQHRPTTPQWEKHRRSSSGHGCHSLTYTCICLCAAVHGPPHPHRWRDHRLWPDTRRHRSCITATDVNYNRGSRPGGLQGHGAPGRRRWHAEVNVGGAGCQRHCPVCPVQTLQRCKAKSVWRVWWIKIDVAIHKCYFGHCKSPVSNGWVLHSLIQFQAKPKKYLFWKLDVRILCTLY